jgi:serum/glucocorticoid-regulated kinase 2
MIKIYDELKIHDELKFIGNNNISKAINDEEIYYSGSLLKINQKSSEQQRNLVITSKALYNFKKKEKKRRFDISKLTGITVSKISDEFVIHGDDEEYDYHYKSQNKNIIIGYISLIYAELNGYSLKLSVVNKESLDNYVTSKQDKKMNKNYSRMDTQYLIDIIDYLNSNNVFADDNDYNINKDNNLLPERSNYNNMVKFNDNDKVVSFYNFDIVEIIGNDYNKVLIMEFEGKKFRMKSLEIDDKEIKLFKNGKILFVNEIEYCFKSPERIYFLTSYNNEKSLNEILKEDIIINEEKVKFFIINIGLALENLHNNNIIYAVLKPENILLGEDGYFYINDILISKIEQDKKLFNNKIEYLSLDILKGNEYDKSSDWWSLGIIIYEMLCGVPPFFEENKEKLIKRIESNIINYPKNSKISDLGKNLISKFLCVDKDKRIPNFDDLKNEEFLENIDINNIREKQYLSPFKSN